MRVAESFCLSESRACKELTHCIQSWARKKQCRSNRNKFTAEIPKYFNHNLSNLNEICWRSKMLIKIYRNLVIFHIWKLFVEMLKSTILSIITKFLRTSYQMPFHNSLILSSLSSRKVCVHTMCMWSCTYEENLLIWGDKSRISTSSIRSICGSF